MFMIYDLGFVDPFIVGFRECGLFRSIRSNHFYKHQSDWTWRPSECAWRIPNALGDWTTED